jgi:carbonic anhydrase/acetyltransferase-like protein (isoleucine patch superfamily)
MQSHGCVVKDNVLIGTVMDNCVIENSIVAAGAVVTQNTTNSGSIWAGVRQKSKRH